MGAYTETELYYLQNLKEAQYNLWNALLTINGVMVSGFSLVLAIGTDVNRAVVTWLIVACCVSLLAILWNYLVIKWHYLALGRDPEEIGALPEKVLETERSQAGSRHKWVQYREYAALVLLVVEVLLIAALVYGVLSAA